MFIYAGRNYTASKTGTAVREVKCEKCGCDYRYRLFRRGTGVASSAYYLNNKGAARRAEAGAAKNLQKLLLFGVDAVACPDCGWIQSEMVAELRRRAHRWLVPLGITLAILFAVTGCLFGMIATHDLTRPLNSSDTIVLILLIAATIIGGVGPFVLRRVLLRGKNPNRNYPQRPDPIPGAPKSFRPGEEGVLDALPAETEADGGLSYPRRPTEVEPGGWMTVQIALWPVPHACCSCLHNAEPVKLYTSNSTNSLKLPVRLCPQCARRYRSKSWVLMLVGFVAGGASGYAWAMTWRHFDPFVSWLMAVACGLLGLAIVAVIANSFARPVRFSRFNGPLNTIRVKFRNPDYIAVFVNEEPPPSPTARSPIDIAVPPPARPWQA